MDFDPHSGDYGLGFFGNALESGAYYVQHARLGALCYLCTATTNSTTGVSTITPEDAYHRRVFLQPLGVYLPCTVQCNPQSRLRLSRIALTEILTGCDIVTV